MALRDDYKCVDVKIDGEGIAWVTFNRPEKRNAMNPTLHYEMEDILMHLETDPAAKVIVLTGAGKAWSAGMDLKEYFRETDNNPDAFFRAFSANKHWSWDILANSRKPTVAMVNGYVFGGAFVSLCNCDIVITDEAAIYGLSEINWGIIPAGVVSKVIVDKMPLRDALFYSMTGRTFDGKKAVEMNLANIAVPADRLREETVEICRELMGKNPVALAYTKQAIRNVVTMDVPQAYEYLMTKIQALLAADPEKTRNRGIEEFIDKKTYRPGFEAVKRPD
jgi:trans-feruloyl-CoA hydratase/vanillin synthase